jgi:hypothetical protein
MTQRFDNALRWRAALHPRQTAITPAFLADLIRTPFGGAINLSQIDFDYLNTRRRPNGQRAARQ